MLRAPFAVVGLAGGLAALCAAWPAHSATTAELKSSAGNAVPACITPAALMQHVARLNPKLDPRFRDIAGQYQTHGQALGLRWDYAFFHMLAETDNLAFTSDVRKEHNNFAGIRTPDGSKPDRFADVSTGVQAHLHHIRLYAGSPVAKPAAARTKQVEKFILSWSRQLKRPVTFEDMIGRWSPSNPGYAQTIDTALKEFRAAHCAGEVATGVRPADSGRDGRKPAALGPNQPPRAAATGKPEKPDRTASLDVAPRPKAPISDDVAPAFDTPAAAAAEPARTTSHLPPPAGLGMPAGSQVALTQSVAAGPPSPPAADPQEPDKASSGSSAGAHCKVWSASFGGDKSVLIRVVDGQSTHFTALQVNAGREKEETTAYIAAYARGGRTVGEFTSPDQAISKAFELCPKA